MKSFTKRMLMWLAVYALVGVVLLVLNLSWVPVMDAYHDMSVRQIGIYSVMAVLLTAWVLICWHDSVERRKHNKIFYEKESSMVDLGLQCSAEAKKAPVHLVLHYRSFIDPENILFVPVKSVVHAQEIIDLLSLDQSMVGYHSSITDKFVPLYVQEGTTLKPA